MAAIAPIVINDGKATPVAHTFQPVATNPPNYRENGNAAVPIVGESESLLNLKRGSGSVQKAVVTLRVPVLETQSGSASSGYEAPPKVAYYLQANIELFLHDRTTGDQRKDLRVLASNLLKDAQVLAMVDKLEHPY
jgi:hypothetical protein